MKFDKNLLKKPEYKGVKPYKYIPLLEKQVKIEMDSKRDWMEAALDCQEDADQQRGDKRSLLFFLGAIAIILCLEDIILLGLL